MSFGINIGKSGITGAILQKLREENISVKKLDISVWQEIMDVIKDDENIKKVYSGSTDLRDNNAFFVAKATTVQISEALWNKVLNIVCRQNGTLQAEPAMTQSHQTSGSNSAENNPALSNRINLASEYPELPCTSSFDIDFDALTPDKLKERFPESDYTIETSSGDEEYVVVSSRKDGKTIFSYGKMLTKFGDEIRTINIEYNGVPSSLTYLNGKFSQRTTYKSNGEGYLINTQERFDENFELISKDIWNEDNTGFVTQNFSNGILCDETGEKRTAANKTTESLYDCTRNAWVN